MVVNKITNKIMTLGFTEYESKAYLYLLKIQPATAYEISRESGIPSSKIYEVLARLIDKEIVMIADDGKKKKYVAIPPEEFIQSRKSAYDATFEALEASLPELQEEQRLSYIWNITGYQHLMDKARRMIENTHHTILLSAWGEELNQLSPTLDAAQSRGVQIASVHFGDTLVSAGQMFHHPIGDTIYEEKGGRGLVAVCDSSAALIGTINTFDGTEGAWSTNQGFITLAEDYIKHDIYIMKIVSRFDDLLLNRFGDNYMHLRNIFEDKDTQ